jgi:hypothetical protein
LRAVTLSNHFRLGSGRTRRGFTRGKQVSEQQSSDGVHDRRPDLHLRAVTRRLVALHENGVLAGDEEPGGWSARNIVVKREEDAFELIRNPRFGDPDEA